MSGFYESRAEHQRSVTRGAIACLLTILGSTVLVVGSTELTRHSVAKPPAKTPATGRVTFPKPPPAVLEAPRIQTWSPVLTPAPLVVQTPAVVPVQPSAPRPELGQPSAVSQTQPAPS